MAGFPSVAISPSSNILRAQFEYEMSKKVGRNDRCPCGSGKKYKKCHIGQIHADPMSPEFQAKAWAHFDSKIAAEKKRKEKYGHVRPIVHATAWGKKLVVVGNRIYFNNDAKLSFSDFLQVFLREALGENWWREEISKPVIARHPIAQWQGHAEDLANGTTRSERGYSIPYDGTVASFMILAYDLYVVRDNVRFQEVIIERLKRRDNFVGVRYELLVAATFVRAGFSIEPEEDEAATKPHPEFVATHKETNFMVAVEAKARNRRQNDLQPTRVQVFDLVDKAAGQGHNGKPFALFVDVAMPPEPPAEYPSWIAEVDETVKAVVDNHGGTPGPFDCVVFTSFTYPGGLPDRAGLVAPYVTWQPMARTIPPAILEQLFDAVNQFGHIPEFETGS
jgi:hypothetical protein